MCFPFVHTGGIYILKNKLVALDPELLFADGYDDCIIGLTFRNDTLVVLYGTLKIISKLTKDMSEEEAWDFFEFNISGAYVGERTPVFYEDIFE
jgi:hypothetical protein